MRRLRRGRRRLRQEILAPWVAMVVIVAAWALGAWFINAAPPLPALEEPFVRNDDVFGMISHRCH